MSDAKRTALITGASVGIGRDLAVVAAEQGHDLVIVARNREQLDALATELREKFKVRVEVLPKDLAKPQAASELFEEIKQRNITIDILINNAGFGIGQRFDRTEVDPILGMVQVNVAALTHLMRLFLPQMIERKFGRIMNVASVAAYLPGPFLATYYATKAYVLSLSEAVAAELKHTGVTITAVCPGPTQTEFSKRANLDKAAGFKGPMMMDSMTVARIGYRAMMKGRRVSVTGIQNRMLVGLLKIVPRRMATAIVAKFNAA